MNGVREAIGGAGPGSATPYRVALVDDHAIVRQGLRGILEKAGLEVVGEAKNGLEALELVRALAPDFAILDLSMPVLNGLDVADELRRTAARTRTIMLTMHANKAYVQQALQAGVAGYVLKSQAAEDLLEAIEYAARGAIYLSPSVAASVVDSYLGKDESGEVGLSPRERQILLFVAEGRTTRDIAGLLHIRSKTAESHRHRMMKKLGLHDVSAVVRYAIRQGLLHP